MNGAVRDELLLQITVPIMFVQVRFLLSLSNIFEKEFYILVMVLKLSKLSDLRSPSPIWFNLLLIKIECL